jgi:hypothetical protein
VSPRELRVKRNQDLFREVNERIAELASDWIGEDFTIVCECANTGCAETVRVKIAEYLRNRADPGRYIVKVGHQGTESVEERHPEYLVVRVD